MLSVRLTIIYIAGKIKNSSVASKLPRKVFGGTVDPVYIMLPDSGLILHIGNGHVPM